MNYLPQLRYMKDEISRGRNVHDGCQRGWGLQLGNVADFVADDPVYQRALALANAQLGIMLPSRLMNLFLILKFYLSKVDGDIIEFGCYQGGSAMFMAAICRELHPTRKVYALDTVRQAADAAGLDNLVLVKGLFQDTAPSLVAGGAFALAHIDCDIKSSVSYAYDVIQASLSVGGYIVFDDATASSCLGATEAVEEIIQAGNYSEQIWPHFVFRHGLA